MITGNNTKYPNFLELFKYYPCGEPAVCEHAGIEPELLETVLEGGEELLPEEIQGLGRLYCCPVGVIQNPRVIMLDMDRYKHRNMVADVNRLYACLQQIWENGGNETAKYYYEPYSWMQQRFREAAYHNQLSYGHYLGVKERFEQLIRWSVPPLKKRGLS